MSQSLRPAFIASLASLALSPIAQAQLDATVLVREGDVFANGWTAVAVQSHDLDDAGGWVARVFTDNPGASSNEVLLHNGNLELVEGSPYLGETVAFLGDAALDDEGKMAVRYTVVNPNGSSDALSRIAIEGQVVMSEDDVLSIPGIASGATVNQILYMDWALPYLTTVLELNVPGTGLTRVHVTFGVDDSGPLTLVSPTLHAQTGMAFPGVPAPLEQIFNPSVDKSGNVTASFVFDDMGTTRSGIYRNTFAYMVDTTPGIFVGSTWNSGVLSPEVAVREGRYASTGQVQLSNGSDVGIVLGPFGRVAQETGSINGDPTLQIASFRYTDVDVLADSRVLYAVPLVFGGEAMVLEDELLLQTGESRADGTLITSIPFTLRSVLHISSNARFASCRVSLEGGIDSLVRVERQVGTVAGCPVIANSTGSVGRLFALGSSVAEFNDLEIIAMGLPTSSFGYLLASDSPGFAMNPGGSSGNLCLGGGIGRYVDQIASSGGLGRIRTQIDLTNVPQPTGPVSVTAGETWGFQLWHRDTDGGGMPTSNFTEMLFIDFE